MRFVNIKCEKVLHMIYIYIEIQKPNRFKDFLHKIYDRLEDLIFAIIQKFEIINKIHFTT
mgnify:CR=1 FL=1